MSDGLVLVWDVDHTLSGQYFDPKLFTNPKINPLDYVILNLNALEVIKKAIIAKTTGGVSKIGILTNNDNEEFISLVKEAISIKIGNPNPFDFTITANRQNQNVGPNGQLIKSIATIQDKLPGEENLIKRVYFFDDMPDHVIRKEFGEEFKDHYIQITPPFSFEIKDRTNWEPILDALATIPPASKGGRRQRRRPAKKSRRRNKKRSHQSRSIRDGSN
jgi:hypothetical protein